MRELAAANEAIISAGYYDSPAGRRVPLSAMVATACQGTVCYTPATLADMLSGAEPGDTATVVEVTGEPSMSAAHRLLDAGAGEVTVLNFASARSPGGGYLNGARAQEEDLCRVSALYTTLLRAPDFYAAHRADASLAYSHRVIFSPDVPVYRDERYRLLPEPYPVSFLSCAAPNTGVLSRDRADLSGVPRILAERAAGILAVAARNRRRSLVLGAWGCGVFRNDPRRVAAAFRSSLMDPGRFTGVFDHVVFAVLDRAPGQHNLTAFRDAFGRT